MPAGPRPRRDATDDWNQLRLLVTSSEQASYEVLRPIVLFGQSIPDRARETGMPERTLRRRVARFAALGMRSLFANLMDPQPDRRRLPAEIRRPSSRSMQSIRPSARARSPGSAGNASTVP